MIRAPNTTAYVDGKSLPPFATLPSPRRISNALFDQLQDTPSPKLSLLSIYALQLLDHDLTLTAVPSYVLCRKPGEPMPIYIPEGDAAFAIAGQTPRYMDFSRADYCVSASGARQHLNALTGTIDASFLYGSTVNISHLLRSHVGGRMLMTADGLPPQAVATGLLTSQDKCRTGFPCFAFGDQRGNENIVLSSLHVLWLREHNRQADAIRNADSSLDDETVFQQARKRVMALNQNMVFYELMPTVLGKSCPALTQYSGFNPTVDGQMRTEFSTAAFRFGHTGIANTITLIDSAGVVSNILQLRDFFFNPAPLNPSIIPEILLGTSRQAAQDLDIKAVHTLRNLLFTKVGVDPNPPPGLDLMALNIQRGRDLGLRSYNDIRAAYGLPRKTTFAQITSNQVLAKALEAVYTTVDSVEMWPGGLAEDKAADSQLGELFSTVVCNQLIRTRASDSFYFELPGQLSPAEVTEIRNTRFADIVARNTPLSRNIMSTFMFAQEPGYRKFCVFEN